MSTMRYLENTWRWVTAHWIKTSMALIAAGCIIALIAETALGRLTPYYLDVLQFVRSLGAWVSSVHLSSSSLAINL